MVKSGCKLKGVSCFYESLGFEGGIPDFMDGIPDFMDTFNTIIVAHWRNFKLKSLNSMPQNVYCILLCRGV